MKPSLEICSEANPVLWALFCSITNRDPGCAAGGFWTEQDVVLWAKDWINKGRASELQSLRRDHQVDASPGAQPKGDA